jgi:tetratricopeptide (TPR) repeat protein
LEILHRVADLDPHNVETRLKLAEGYLRENLGQEAADAFTEAGGQLLARGNYERALEAFNRALEFSTHNYTAWDGVVTAYTALNAPDEAARALQQAGALESNDIELISLLAQAHLADDNAADAERVAHLLLKVDAGSYTSLLDTARLYLKLNQSDDCVRVLASIVDPILNAHAETALIYALDEALARNPEHLEALRLLVRVYKWQREEENLRKTLERFVEVARTLALEEDERWALEQLQSLTLNNEYYGQRLRELGGEDSAEPSPARLMPESEAALYDSLVGLTTGVADTGELNPEVLNATSPGAPGEMVLEIGEDAPARDFQMISSSDSGKEDLRFGEDETASQMAEGSFADLNVAEPAAEIAAGGLDEHHVKALQQELESVDFYLTQGYYDIAQDTLDMLERQFGPQPNILERRAQLPPPEPSPDADAPESFAIVDDLPETPAPEFAAPEEVSFAIMEETVGPPALEGNTFLITQEVALPSFPPEPEASDEAMWVTEPPPPVTDFAAAPTPPAVEVALHANGQPALDPGLVEIFDEFRVAVEEESQMASDNDFETHYNLGLAYKEMDLVDEAIEEFQIAVKLSVPQDGTLRHLHCCSLLGHCFMQKGLPRVAVMWFQRGSETPNLPEDTVLALHYETGLAYEQMGDMDRAIETFMQVYGVNVSYRGVADKLREIQTLQLA